MAQKINTVSVSGQGLKGVQQHIKRLEKLAVSVGIHEDVGEHDKGESTVAQIGAWNEYGAKHTPERSFMRSTINKKLRSYRQLLARVLRRAIEKPSTAARNMGKVGQTVKQDVQSTIVAIRQPENAESTKRNKKGVDNPLIDSGQMLQSIHWHFLKKPVDKEDDVN